MPPSEPSRVFISYARSDGADYAARLRERLEKDYPEIKLWQDVISLHSGKDLVAADHQSPRPGRLHGAGGHA